MRAIAAEAQGSPQLRHVMKSFWATRLTQVGPLIEGAIQRHQLPETTSPAELMKYVAAPLYYQLLMTDEPITQATADRAAAAALAAARAGALDTMTPRSSGRRPSATRGRTVTDG